MINIISKILPAIISSAYIFSADSSNISYNHSKIVPIPDLSFITKVYTGLDILEQMDFRLIKGKSVAVLTNQTAVNRNGVHILDLLKSYEKVKVSFILAMEHGIWGLDDKRATLLGREQVDPLHKAPIIDLFETYVYPPSWVMDKIDLIIIDFQGTGSRYPTFFATMSKVFEAASNHKVPILLLDRPNPIRGDIINGPIPRTDFQSYESYHLFPIRHGLTIGEAALIINELGWTKDSKRVDLEILPMANWNRNMWFDETKLFWRNPKPSLTNEINLLAYVGMDLFRGTNMNLGFGTNNQYLMIGAPWLETSFLIKKLDDLNLNGVSFEDLKYRPNGSIYHDRIPKYDGQSCSGIKIKIDDRNNFEPIQTATSIIALIHRLHPKHFQWQKENYIDKLFGSNELRVHSAQGKPLDHLPGIWQKDIYRFSEFRKPYLIYR